MVGKPLKLKVWSGICRLFPIWKYGKPNCVEVCRSFLILNQPQKWTHPKFHCTCLISGKLLLKLVMFLVNQHLAFFRSWRYITVITHLICYWSTPPTIQIFPFLRTWHGSGGSRKVSACELNGPQVLHVDPQWHTQQQCVNIYSTSSKTAPEMIHAYII